jgi:glutamate formiminotransferase/formiminotetrahydrofolate cyclodeaminase
MEKTREIIPLLQAVAERGNVNSVSDAGVGAHCALTCAEGAGLNVKINLLGIKDKNLKEECLKRMEEALDSIRSGCRQIIKMVEAKLV